MPSEPGRPIPYLDDVCAEFPELVIVGGHIGYPWQTEMIHTGLAQLNRTLNTGEADTARTKAIRDQIQSLKDRLPPSMRAVRLAPSTWAAPEAKSPPAPAPIITTS